MGIMLVIKIQLRNEVPEKSVVVRDIGFKSATLSASHWLT